MQTFCFEVIRHGQRIYVGKAVTTAEAVRATFPYCEITGNTVLIFAVGY